MKENNTDKQYIEELEHRIKIFESHEEYLLNELNDYRDLVSHYVERYNEEILKHKEQEKYIKHLLDRIMELEKRCTILQEKEKNNAKRK